MTFLTKMKLYVVIKIFILLTIIIYYYFYEINQLYSVSGINIFLIFYELLFITVLIKQNKGIKKRGNILVSDTFHIIAIVGPFSIYVVSFLEGFSIYFLMFFLDLARLSYYRGIYSEDEK